MTISNNCANFRAHPSGHAGGPPHPSAGTEVWPVTESLTIGCASLHFTSPGLTRSGSSMVPSCGTGT